MAINFKRFSVEHWLRERQECRPVGCGAGINAQTLKIWKQQLAVMPPVPTAGAAAVAIHAASRRRLNFFR